MLKNQENSKINYQKNTIYQKRNKFQSNRSNYTDKSKSKKYTYIFENNYPNSSFKSIQNNIVYKKPSLNNNTEIQNADENIFIINDLKENIKQNETKLEKVNKTMQEILLKQNEDQNISKEYYSQINELEKIQQENLTLKADLIIYREDILHLSEINRKLKLEYDLSQKKIFDLISKLEDSNQTLNNKNFEIAQLTEAISNTKLSNSNETMKKIKNNKTKEQQIYEYEFELDKINKEKIKLETEIKNLEEKYNSLMEEKNKNEKEEEFYKNRINENISGLEDKIKNLGNQMDELNIINKELKLKNQKYENNINFLKNETNNFIDKYNEKTEQINELEKEFKNLENKYSQILYEVRKRNLMKENDKNQEDKNDYIKPKKRKSSKQIIVNDLYNKIKEIKENIKSERKFNN
jgi:chromosome segregation ATPase